MFIFCYYVTFGAPTFFMKTNGAYSLAANNLTQWLKERPVSPFLQYARKCCSRAPQKGQIQENKILFYFSDNKIKGLKLQGPINPQQEFCKLHLQSCIHHLPNSKKEPASWFGRRQVHFLKRKSWFRRNLDQMRKVRMYLTNHTKRISGVEK
jgi:hypothetical protein